jgi:hypothetical protein
MLKQLTFETINVFLKLTINIFEAVNVFFSKKPATFFSPFHALNRKILNKSSGVEEVNYCNTLPLFRYFLSLLFC